MRVVRVAIDARCVDVKLSGPGRYVLNLLSGLSLKDSDLEFLIFYRTPFVRKALDILGGRYRSRFQWIKTKSIPGSKAEKLEISWLLKLHRAHVFHDVNLTGAGRLARGVPSIMTVHELGVLYEKLANKDYQPSNKLIERTRRRLLRADRIIAVSETVAQDLEAYFHISRPKIDVISNAVDAWYFSKPLHQEIVAMRERFKITGRFVLCVSPDRPLKNLNLIKDLAGSKPEIAWVFTSPTPDSPVRAPNMFYLGAVDDLWLRALYAAASAVVVPSLYEGFSLPPLEALAAGSIPLVSRIKAHEENLVGILDEQAFFDPSQIADLARAIDWAWTRSDAEKEVMRRRFFDKAEQYECAHLADQCQKKYREM